MKFCYKTKNLRETETGTLPTHSPHPTQFSIPTRVFLPSKVARPTIGHNGATPLILLTKDQLPFRQAYLPVADLISTQRSRLYASHQIAIEFMQAGTCRPVLIDKDNRIVNGHHRVDAAKILGFVAIRAIQFTEHTREDYLELKDEIELQSGGEIDIELPVEYDPEFFFSS